MKRGFVVYFDNCRRTAALPDEEFAAVWRTLFRYAELLAEGGDDESFLAERVQSLPAGAGMAVSFIAGNLKRDHRSYMARTGNRQKPQKPKQAPPADSRDAAWSYL